jgi:2-polyprenyl-3-methyl-5-hydroxy-6-metoxy-1,4-benzoquinol methylase
MYSEKKECRCCGNTELHKFIDFGSQPLANSYQSMPDDQPEFPLAVNVCKNCFHTQLTVVVHPDVMFRQYAYVSGTSQTLRAYFDWFANMVSGYFPNNSNVLDIACNDGSQLDSFKSLGWNTCGVDPAENITPIAKAKGHQVETAYWTQQVAERFHCKSGKAAPFDAIIAQNVFAHTDDILEFLLACKKVMHERSKLFIQTSQANMYLNGEFDTIYHEHLSFFNTQSMLAIAYRAGLRVESVSKTDIHGTSYVFVLTLLESELTFGGGVERVLMEEYQQGLCDLDTYIKFGERAMDLIQELKYTIRGMEHLDYKVVGFGAAAKGMTVLNAGKITLEYIVDESKLKQQKFTPGMNIPIVGPQWLYDDDYERIAIVPLAWNFFTEIKHKVKSNRTNENDRFLLYFPNIRVEK